jgi:hypothetical protein
MVASRFGDAKAKSEVLGATGTGVATAASGLGDSGAGPTRFCCAAAPKAADKIKPSNTNMYRIGLLPPPQTTIPDVPIFNLSNELSGCL